MADFHRKHKTGATVRLKNDIQVNHRIPFKADEEIVLDLPFADSHFGIAL